MANPPKFGGNVRGGSDGDGVGVRYFPEGKTTPPFLQHGVTISRDPDLPPPFISGIDNRRTNTIIVSPICLAIIFL